MLKRVIFIFTIILLVTVGVLKYQRSQRDSTAHFLLLNNNLLGYIPLPSEIFLLHPNGTLLRKIPHDNLNIISPLYWSSNDNYLYFIDELDSGSYYSFRIHRLNYQTGKSEILEDAFYMQVSYSGQQWAYSTLEGQLFSASNEILVNDQQIDNLPSNSDENWAYYVVDSCAYRVSYSDTIRERLTCGVSSLGSLIVAPNGEYIAFIDTNSSIPTSTITWMNISEKRTDIVAKSNSYPIIDWSPNSQILAIAVPASDYSSSSIFLANSNTGKVKELTTVPSFINRLVWSKDGRWLYYSDGNGRDVQIYRVNTETGAREYIFNNKEKYRSYPYLSWSPILDENWHPQWFIMSGILILLGLSAVSKFSNNK